MKKSFFCLVTVLFLIDIGRAEGLADDAEKNKWLSSSVSIDNYDFSDWPNLRLDRRDYLELEGVKAIGFSPSGLFAYHYDSVSDAAENCCSGVVVKNFVNDEEIKHFASEMKEGFGTGWINWSEVTPELKRLKIEPLKNAHLEPFPFKTADDEFNAEINLIEDPNSCFDGKKGQIIFRSKRLGRKVLGEVSGRRCYGRSIKVVGFIKSPFEKRLAVVIGMATNGMGDTDPRWVDFKFFGAHLKVGFSEKSPYNKSLKPTNPARGVR